MLQGYTQALVVFPERENKLDVKEGRKSLILALLLHIPWSRAWEDRKPLGRLQPPRDFKKPSTVLILFPPFRISWPCFGATCHIFIFDMLTCFSILCHGKPGCAKFPYIYFSFTSHYGLFHALLRCSGIETNRDEQTSIIPVENMPLESKKAWDHCF